MASKTTIGVSLIILGILMLIGTICYHVYVNYQYEKIIGGHMENAYDMNTPSRMLEELNLAKQAMYDAGLTPDRYGAVIFKQPNNRMDFQYEHLDSIIERVKAVEEWRVKMYEGKDVQVENLGDVYEQKMDNLREFVMETTRSDWIAEDTWWVKNHVVFYLFDWIIYILSLGMIGLGIYELVRYEG